MSENKVMTKNELMEKYYSLVWYARSISDEPEVAAARKEVRDLYPKEIDDLSTESNGDWQHGFNSGMLACLRLLSGGRTTPATMEEFPMLNS